MIIKLFFLLQVVESCQRLRDGLGLAQLIFKTSLLLNGAVLVIVLIIKELVVNHLFHCQIPNTVQN